MSIRSQQAATARLREAIEVYRAKPKIPLDKSGGELLDRLADSDDARKAFALLRLKDRKQERNFLFVCIVAERLARRFPELIGNEEKMPKRLLRLKKASSDLRLFVEEQTSPPPAPDALSVWDGMARALRLEQATPDRPSFGLLRVVGRFAPHHTAEMIRGLNMMDSLIEIREILGRMQPKWLGATRDKRHKNASILLGIGCVAVGVRELTGKAHKAEIRGLAPVILGRDLPDESVTYALRKSLTDWQRWNAVLKKSAFAGVKRAEHASE
jgi:hypothetical protein